MKECRLIELIKKTKENIDNYDIQGNYSYNLKLWLDLIETCANKKAFFACAIQLRSYRNLIYSFVNENTFMHKYRNILFKYDSYKFLSRANHDNCKAKRSQTLGEIKTLLKEVARIISRVNLKKW